MQTQPLFIVSLTDSQFLPAVCDTPLARRILGFFTDPMTDRVLAVLKITPLADPGAEGSKNLTRIYFTADILELARDRAKLDKGLRKARAEIKVKNSAQRARKLMLAKPTREMTVVE